MTNCSKKSGGRTHTAWFISRLNMLLALGRFHSQEVIPIQKLMLGLQVDEELLEKLKKTFGTEASTSVNLFTVSNSCCYSSKRVFSFWRKIL
jgi:hypothetical protein